ncbi:Metal tolerance protein C1 [Zea mays]|uniref:Metal tolerance protein C1 n=1 Tax=Zea mays TaxID=4577 RepID=A0A1D6K2U8_MAIZE|nr:Metal tolerance protein C1 [Zea mays]
MVQWNCLTKHLRLSTIPSDNILEILVYITLVLSVNPEDIGSHISYSPFVQGHGKFESLGALGISSMLLVTSGGIAWHAFEVLQVYYFSLTRFGVMSSAPDIIGNTLHAHHDHGSSGHHHGIDLEHPVLALSMTTLAISIKEGLYWITKRAGEKEGSGLMKANAWHHRADAISSVVALVGVGKSFTNAGGSILGLPLLDPLAGLVVSGMILKAGIKTGYESLHDVTYGDDSACFACSVLELVDAAVDPSLLEPIKETILRVHGVKGCHRLRGRKAGTSLYLDVHIEVYPFLSVSAAHDIDPSYLVGPTMDLKRILKDSDGTNSEAIPRQQSAEAIVSNIISSHFSEAPGVSSNALVEHLLGNLTVSAQDFGMPQIEKCVDGLGAVGAVVLHSPALPSVQKMALEHLMLHYVQGRVLLQVQVSMSPEILIRDAMEVAKQAEEEILRADASISQISLQLRLGQQIKQLQLASQERR